MLLRHQRFTPQFDMPMGTLENPYAEVRDSSNLLLPSQQNQKLPNLRSAKNLHHPTRNNKLGLSQSSDYMQHSGSVVVD